MKHLLLKLVLAGVLATSFTAVARAQVNLGVDFPVATAFDYGPSTWNLGYEFTVNSPTLVVGLANWSAPSVGLPQSQQVGLWDVAGDLLTSAYINATDSFIGQGSFQWHAITPYLLTPGTTYIVGGQGGADYTGMDPNPVYYPGLNYIQDMFSSVSGGSNDPLTFPTSTLSLGASAPDIFGGNIVLATPEPASLALFVGIGITGVIARLRRRL